MAFGLKRLHKTSEDRSRAVSWLYIGTLPYLAAAASSEDDTLGFTENEPSLEFAMSWVVIGFLTLVMGVFYLVNYTDKDIQKATWVTLSNTTSLFCALLIFDACDKIIRLPILLSADGASGSGHSNEWSCAKVKKSVTDPLSLFIGFSQMVLWFVLVQVSLARSCGTPQKVAAWGNIGGHIVGFSAVKAFYPLLFIDAFASSAYLNLVVVLIAALSFMLLAVMANLSRIRFLRFRGRSEEDPIVLFWLHQAEHTENELTAFALGFLISMCVRFGLVGCAARLHWAPDDTGSVEQMTGLLLCVLLFAVLLIACSWLNRCSRISERQCELIEVTLAMSMGWCMLYLGHWMFWIASDGNGLIGNGDVMAAKTVVTFFCTCFGFAMLLVIDFAADRLPFFEHGLRSTSEAFVLLLGLSWESTFVKVLEASQKKATDNTQDTLMTVVKALVLCFLVVPAWIMYIMPKAYLASASDAEEDEDGRVDSEHGAKVKRAASKLADTYHRAMRASTSEGEVNKTPEPGSATDGDNFLGQDTVLDVEIVSAPSAKVEVNHSKDEAADVYEVSQSQQKLQVSNFNLVDVQVQTDLNFANGDCENTRVPDYSPSDEVDTEFNGKDANEDETVAPRGMTEFVLPVPSMEQAREWSVRV
eukprot:TRINITY_DN98586_c0_g1_i1.p1 TRINITY_DN98586_c0_g1~~TRINITY_DN98586_c0_g1_i1.p1  ORF type:complete len:644 (-),score=106.84 TRINITY_DN98586_c0_g1_i1:54-1985(-)